MKIVLFDSVRKFTDDLIDNWRKSGHEVIIDRYFDPTKVHWADLSFFEFCDLSIQRASDPNDKLWDTASQPQDKIIICRAHDLDIFVGHYKGVNWRWVNHLVFVSKFMQNRMLSDIRLPKETKVHLIHHGINTDKFTYKEKAIGKKIAFIGNINDSKRMETCLLVLAELPRDYSLYVVGSGLSSWRECYVRHYIKENNLNVTFIERVDNISDFLQDKNFLLLPSEKEAFSFVVGEAMACGVKPIIHNFAGAKDIWPEKLIWNTISEAKELIMEEEYEPELYRNYVEANYPLQKMLDLYNEVTIKK